MTAAEPASQGSMRAYLFDSWAVFLSPELSRAEHRHGVMQLSISLGPEPHRVGTHGGAEVAELCHLVAPNTPHSLHCSAPTMVAWVERESELGRRLAQAHLGTRDHASMGAELQQAVASDELVLALGQRWDAAAFAPVGARLYESLTGRLDAPTTAVHPAIRKALRKIREDPSAKVRAPELAAHVGLSEGRLLHLFKEQVGLPLRAYMRWRRVFGALAMIACEGASATTAAAALGFSDSAHLTRVMSDFLAISPSGYARRAPGEFEIVDCTLC